MILFGFVSFLSTLRPWLSTRESHRPSGYLIYLHMQNALTMPHRLARKNRKRKRESLELHHNARTRMQQCPELGPQTEKDSSRKTVTPYKRASRTPDVDDPPIDPLAPLLVKKYESMDMDGMQC